MGNFPDFLPGAHRPEDFSDDATARDDANRRNDLTNRTLAAAVQHGINKDNLEWEYREFLASHGTPVLIALNRLRQAKAMLPLQPYGQGMIIPPVFRGTDNPRTVSVTYYFGDSTAKNVPVAAYFLAEGVAGGSNAPTMALPMALGGTGVVVAADDTVLVGSGTAWVAKTLPDCSSGTKAVAYDQASNAFSAVSLSPGGGGSVPWSLAAKPASADAFNEEFEGTAFSGWTQSSSMVSTTIDPWAGFNTANQIRHSWNILRPSWLMLQASADNQFYVPIHKSVTLNTDDIFWGRFSYDLRLSGSETNNDNNVGLKLCMTSAGAPDLNNSVNFWFCEADGGATDFQWEKIQGGVTTSAALSQIGGNSICSSVPEYALIWKKTNDYYFFYNSNQGGWRYLGTINWGGGTIDRVGLSISNNNTGTPGNMIIGCDFIRRIQSPTWFPG